MPTRRAGIARTLRKWSPRVRKTSIGALERMQPPSGGSSHAVSALVAHDIQQPPIDRPYCVASIFALISLPTTGTSQAQVSGESPIELISIDSASSPSPTSTERPDSLHVIF